MQQITFENWKQLGLKVGDPILIIDTVGNVEYRTIIDAIHDASTHWQVDHQPIRFSDTYSPDEWQWIDFEDTYFTYFTVNSQEEQRPKKYEVCDLFIDHQEVYSVELRGYFYDSETNTIETRNVIPHKILKHSTNQNGERVWKLRGTWVTDTQIKNAINPPKQTPVQNAQYMIASIVDNHTSIVDQTIYTDTETLKQEMQKLALANPRNKFVAVQLTDIKVSLDLSNPVFKWD